MKRGMLWKLSLALVLTSAIFLSACGAHEHEPVSIDEHTHRCAICNMSVVDNRYATQIIKKDGQPVLFDDIGCMFEWLDRNGSDEVGIAFVRDHDSLAWLKMEDAWYVYDSSIRTPMAYGVVSFADEEVAKAYASGIASARVYDSGQLKNHSWEQNHDLLDGHHHHGHDDHDAHGHDEHGHDAHGHNEHAYDTHGHNEHAHDTHGHNVHGHDRHGHFGHFKHQAGHHEMHYADHVVNPA